MTMRTWVGSTVAPIGGGVAYALGTFDSVGAADPRVFLELMTFGTVVLALFEMLIVLPLFHYLEPGGPRHAIILALAGGSAWVVVSTLLVLALDTDMVTSALIRTPIVSTAVHAWMTLQSLSVLRGSQLDLMQLMPSLAIYLLIFAGIIVVPIVLFTGQSSWRYVVTFLAYAGGLIAVVSLVLGLRFMGPMITLLFPGFVLIAIFWRIAVFERGRAPRSTGPAGKRLLSR